MTATHPGYQESPAPDTAPAIGPDPFTTTYENWRLLQEVLEERDRDWWTEHEDTGQYDNG